MAARTAPLEDASHVGHVSRRRTPCHGTSCSCHVEGSKDSTSHGGHHTPALYGPCHNDSGTAHMSYLLPPVGARRWRPFPYSPPIGRSNGQKNVCWSQATEHEVAPHVSSPERSGKLARRRGPTDIVHCPSKSDVTSLKMSPCAHRRNTHQWVNGCVLSCGSRSPRWRALNPWTDGKRGGP